MIHTFTYILLLNFVKKENFIFILNSKNILFFIFVLKIFLDK
jgi:hypothetical protein